jgi:prevent-host-death family protein
MEKAISAADANRKFSKLLRDVKQGQSYVVTSHDRPVARIAPVDQGHQATNTKAVLLNRLRSQRVLNTRPWKRDDLYD